MPYLSLHSSRDLQQRIAAGDEHAFRQLFSENWDNIYGVAFAFTKSPELAEEITQDVFVKIWVKRERLAGVEQLGSYLYTTARNHILNTLRKKWKEPAFLDQLGNYFLANAYSPEDALLLKESARIIQEAIAHLPSQQRRVYQLSREEGLSQEDIARKLHISKHTVKSHMNKALHSLRDAIGPYSSELMLLVILLWL